RRCLLRHHPARRKRCLSCQCVGDDGANGVYLDNTERGHPVPVGGGVWIPVRLVLSKLPCCLHVTGGRFALEGNSGLFMSSVGVALLLPGLRPTALSRFGGR